MDIEEVAEEFFTHPFSRFSEHPPCGFVDEIVLVWEKSRRDGEYHACITLHDEMQACQNDDPIGPQVIARDASFDEIRAFRFGEVVGEVRTYNVSARLINHIPIIDTVGMLHIKVRKLFNEEGFPFREFHQYKHSDEPFFVVFA